jgi:hypothetical protein
VRALRFLELAQANFSRFHLLQGQGFALLAFSQLAL